MAARNELQTRSVLLRRVKGYKKKLLQKHFQNARQDRMSQLNIEIKAKCHDPGKLRGMLKSQNPDFKGTDHQIDTYFNVLHGRLKLREGKIENSLIHYDREDKKGPKKAKVTLFEVKPESSIKELLTNALGILTVVDKKREIYFIKNVKFHIDEVDGLGTFVEI